MICPFVFFYSPQNPGPQLGSQSPTGWLLHSHLGYLKLQILRSPASGILTHSPKPRGFFLTFHFWNNLKPSETLQSFHWPFLQDHLLLFVFSLGFLFFVLWLWWNILDILSQSSTKQYTLRSVSLIFKKSPRWFWYSAVFRTTGLAHRLLKSDLNLNALSLR